ncbi:ATP-dependent Clp protease ATP-binding subunit [bacterium]|nr:ATP-dependent Clp protease ATP-binding subunit [bacterium]
MTKGNILTKLSENARQSINLAAEIAIQMFSHEIEPIHIFLGIIHNKASLGTRTLYTMGVDMGDILKYIVNDKQFEFKKDSKTRLDFNLSESTKKIIRGAYSIASKLSHVYVGTEHILLSLLKQQDEFTLNLGKKGLDYKAFEEALFNYATYPMGILSKPDNVPSIMPEQSALSVFGRDLVKEAEAGQLDPVIGRDTEIEKIINVLSRRKKNNPIIVGEAGVGKTALIEALSQRIADGNVPQALKESRIIALDISSIMAGSKMRGDVEEKMMAIVKEVTSSSDIIVFIDEIHNILSSGIPGMPSDIVAVLKPALTRNDFRCIGATTSNEYRQYFEEDNALVRRFQPVFVEETSVLDTIQILKRIKPILETHHGVRISKEALEGSVKLSDRYVSERFLPDKAIDLLDEAAATMKLEAEAEYGGISDLLSELRTVQVEKVSAIKKDLMEEAQVLKSKEHKLKSEIDKFEKKRLEVAKSKEYEVDISTVRKVVSKWTGIPITTLGNDERSGLININKSLNRRVVGQNEAVDVVSNAIKRARTGISDEDRPWASFLFLGPTGVGKTELAKALTEELFGNEDRLVQIDMSELMEMHSVSKLIGSPPGYIGYREGGQLTEKIRQHPHSVVLFDEIEKAHNDVLNILLQILEYGHLTDGKGRRVDFKNTVVVLTSNIGAEDIRRDKVLGFVADRGESDNRTDSKTEGAYESMRDQLVKRLKETLRPELINRLDDIVIFRSLTKSDAKKIVDLLISQLNKRLKSVGFKVLIKDKVKEHLVREGFSDEYGARPLRRMLQDSVESVLANHILENPENEGDKKLKEVVLDIKNSEIYIAK